MSAATTAARTDKVRIWSTDIDPASCGIAPKSMSNGKKISLGVWRMRADLLSRDDAGTQRQNQPACHRRSEEHTSELQSLMRISYAVFCLKKQIQTNHNV